MFKSWNTQALLHHDPHKASSKLEYLTTLVDDFTIVALQEVYRNHFAVREALQRANGKHRTVLSFGRRVHAGGIVTLVPDRGWRSSGGDRSFGSREGYVRHYFVLFMPWQNLPFERSQF